MLCEEFDYGSSRGRIVSLEFDENFSPSIPKPSFLFPFHTSYPYLFEFEDEIYCVPETAHAREISLYRAMQFPSGWRKLCTLVDEFAGHDPTLFCHRGRWWLTFTGEVGEDSSSKLFAWHAASLLGPWRPHEENPVKIDLRSSRPAGTPFTYKGNLYRPAQDCSSTYGSQIVINRVLSLTENEFRKRPLPSDRRAAVPIHQGCTLLHRLGKLPSLTAGVSRLTPPPLSMG